MSASDVAKRLAVEVSRARAQADALELAPVVRTVPPPVPPRPSSSRSSSTTAVLVRTPRLPRVPRTAKVSLPVLVGAGLALWLFVGRRKASASSPTLPSPTPPPAPPPSSSPTPPPATPPPAPPPPPVEPKLEPEWQTSATGLVVLNRLPGFRRSTAADRRKDPDVVALASGFLRHDVKTVHLVTAKSGRKWVFAVEDHNNHPSTIGPKNKGVSMFVQE